MVWGVIEWEYKFKLVFMHKNNLKNKGKRLFFRIYCVKCTEISEINFKAYAKQILENTVMLLL